MLKIYEANSYFFIMLYYLAYTSYSKYSGYQLIIIIGLLLIADDWLYQTIRFSFPDCIWLSIMTFIPNW